MSKLLQKLLLKSCEILKQPQEIGGGCTVMRKTNKVMVDKDVFEEMVKICTLHNSNYTATAPQASPKTT